MLIRISRQFWVGDIIDKSMKRHENHLEVGKLYLRAMPVNILSSLVCENQEQQCHNHQSRL